MRKDMKDRKDTRGTKYAYFNGCFFILLLVKSRLGSRDFPTFNYSFTLFINMKTKGKAMHI